MGKLDFVGVGFQKCGTSSMADFLREDENFAIPKQKELHYFCSCRHNKNQKNQLSHFLKQSKVNQIKGEITPCYITQEEYLARLRNYNENLKIIVCIRNPIDRFVSAYIHARKIGAIPANVPPEYVIELENLHTDYIWLSNIVSQGRYVNYIKTLWEYFPKKNTKIVLLEELKAGELNPEKIKKFLNPNQKNLSKKLHLKYQHSNKNTRLRELEESPNFLMNVSKSTSKYLKRNLRDSASLNTIEIRERCEKKLQTIYKESNKDLEKTLGVKLPW
jgi:hypothetical protein